MVSTILGWVTFYHLAQQDLSIFWFRLSAASVFAFFIAYYFFIVRWFLEKQGWYNLLGFLVLIYGLVFGGLALGTGFIIADSETVGSIVRPVFHEFGWWLFYGFATVITLIINWVLIREYLKYPKDRESKILYFLVGLILFAGFNIVFNIVLPVFFAIYEFYELGNYSVLFLLGFTAFSVIRYHLFNIKTIAAEFFTFSIWIILAVRVSRDALTEDIIIDSLLLSFSIIFWYPPY